MADVTIYTIPGCPYCARAKELLKSKSAKFKEITVKSDEDWEKLEKLTGRETVPQIFIKGKHVGGCDDLLALDSKGKLAVMLQ
ncbi:MAG TPA: glutaredoxin 3 [Candidatus Nanoarchaeia archaeon]|nr:glutaredoxin 3 [Candidatus Nanoarchaeia archaeon]